MPEEMTEPKEGVRPGAVGRMRRNCKQVQSCGRAGR